MSSIRQRTTILLAAGVGSLFVAGSLAIYLSIRSALIAQFDATLMARAQALIVASDLENGKLDIDLAVRDFAGFGNAAGGDFFEIISSDGRSQARSPSLESKSLRQSDIAGSSGGHKVRLPDGREGRAASMTFTLRDRRGAPPGAFTVVVASYSGALAEALRSIAAILVLVSAAGLAIALLLVRKGLSFGLRPLENVIASVREVEVDRLDRRVSQDGVPDELKVVVEKVNAMLDRLEDGFRRERRFSSHAAHELRTPLAELKSMVELIERWPEEFNRAHAREMLNAVAESEGLIEALSMLSRAESDTEASEESMALAPAVDGAIGKVERRAAERQLSLRVSIEGEETRTVPVLWKAMLNNLVANAVAYARAGTVVTIDVSPARLIVANETDDLSPEDLPHLRERFWRKSEARSDRSHSGLGLSIVDVCAGRLGAKCVLSLDGSEFRVAVEWV